MFEKKSSIIHFIGNRISYNIYLAVSFLLISIVPLIICTYVYYNRVQMVIGEDAVRFSESNLGQIADKIDSFLVDMDEFNSEILLNSDVISYLSKRPASIFDENAIRQSLNNRMKNFNIMRQYHSIIVYPADGDMYAYGSFTESSIDNFREYSVYHKAVKNWGYTIYEPLHEYKGVTLLGNPPEVFSCAKSLKEKGTGRLLGVLEITFLPKELSTIISNSSKSEKGRVYLVSDEGRVIAGKDPAKVGKYLDTSRKDIISKDKSGQVIRTEDGPVMIVTRKLTTTNWKLVEDIDYRELMRSATNLRDFFILIILVVGGLSSLFVFTSVIVLSKSVSNILKGIRAIKNGDLTRKNKGAFFKEFEFISRNINEMAQNIQQYIKSEIANQKQKSEMELKMLQAQITPHFLYNTLFSVSCMAKNKQEDEIASILDALIALLKVSVSLKTEMLSLRDELNLVDNYISLEKIRSNNKFSVSYQINNELITYEIPKMTLQPIVENCIMHGFTGSKPDYLIKIHVVESCNDILVKVIDNGEGMDNYIDEDMEEESSFSRKDRFSGIGIENVDQKLKLYFGEGYGIVISSERGAGTIASILIPKTPGKEEDTDYVESPFS